jgi:hypothetical protein
MVYKEPPAKVIVASTVARTKQTPAPISNADARIGATRENDSCRVNLAALDTVVLLMVLFM